MDTRSASNLQPLKMSREEMVENRWRQEIIARLDLGQKRVKNEETIVKVERRGLPNTNHRTLTYDRLAILYELTNSR
jgi:hypothetical protein